MTLDHDLLACNLFVIIQLTHEENCGCIAASIVMKAAGETLAFRQCIQTVLRSSVTCVDVPRFSEEHPCTGQLHSFLRLCLPGDAMGQERYKVLTDLLTGDINEDAIVLRVPGGGIDLDLWSLRVAQALLPQHIATFARHRWVNSLSSLQSYSLVTGVHRIGVRAGLLWLTGKIPAPAPGLSQAALQTAHTRAPQQQAWASSDEEVRPRRRWCQQCWMAKLL